MLLELLLLLGAAKLAAEIAERIRVPAVLAEIVVGILLGPSLLGWVGHGDALLFLGELGVILLLLEVGLETDLGGLRAVGRASVLVGVAGVFLPFLGGFGVADLLGQPTNTAIFVGAALTATSVGITARVFGDLRALGTVEARTVLGAAVADDVLGLVILTVVVRLVETGSVSLSAIGGVVAAAALFLVVAGIAAIGIAPRLFGAIDRRARSSGSLVALAVVFTLGLAELAVLARLAPIIGAFVAGLALGRTVQAERIRRDLTPIGHLLIPVFFVSIGVDVDVRQFLDPSVLGLAAALLAVATVGKLVAGVATFGAPGDRVLIGLGMLPRGEVGLIFAGIGLRTGVLGQELYAAVLLVVLGTTLGAPPLLRARLGRVLAARRNAPGQARPADGWFSVDDRVVDLRGLRPSPELAVVLALEAAVLVADDRRRPGPALLDWLSALDRDEEIGWTRPATKAFLQTLRRANARSWRFLETTGMLERMLPELAGTLARRRRDASELDPVQILRWAHVEAAAAFEAPERVLLAALVLDVAGDHAPPAEAAAALARRLRLGVDAEQEIAQLVGDRDLLLAAASRPDALEERLVLPLAFHLGTPDRLRALHLLTTIAMSVEGITSDDPRTAQVDALAERLHTVFHDPSTAVVEARRRLEQARSLVSSADAARLESAPPLWLLSAPPDVLAAQAARLRPRPRRDEVRVSMSEGTGRLEVVGRGPGFLVAITGALETAGVSVRDATCATWPDATVLCVLDVLDVLGAPADRPTDLPARLERSLDLPARPPAPLRDVTLSFDVDASPWHTLLDVAAPDQPGLFHAVAVACADAGASIVSASLRTEDGCANDRFELVSRRGEKLSDLERDAVRRGIGGPGPRPARRRLRSVIGADATHV